MRRRIGVQLRGRRATGDCGDHRGSEPTSADIPQELRSMRERVEALGGELLIESKPGTGTTLALQLPLARPLTRDGAPEGSIDEQATVKGLEQT